MKLTKTAGWSLGTTGLCVALAAGGWFALIDPQRAEAAESRELTVAAQDANVALEAEIEQLRQQFAELPTKQAELAEIRLALPADPALAQLVRDVTLKSADAGTVLDAVTAGAPVAVVETATAVVAPEEAAPAEGAPADPAAEPAPAPSETAAPADGAAAEAAPAPTVPAAGPVLAAIPVTITVQGDFSASTLFLKNLQAEMPRAYLVDSLVVSVTEGEGVDPGTVSSTVTGRVFAFVDPTEIPDVPVLPATPSDG